MVTSTWGGTISGSCAIGIRVRARSPPSVMTIEITIASRGRLMKKEEIIGVSSGWRWTLPGTGVTGALGRAR